MGLNEKQVKGCVTSQGGFLISVGWDGGCRFDHPNPEHRWDFQSYTSCSGVGSLHTI